MRGAEAAPPLAEGRYRLISVLGVGGMATVYKGFDARLQVYRAVKVLSPALAKRRSLKARFEAEASTMAMMHHRNIVAVHDIGSDGNRIFIVMELVEGGSLLDRVREHGPLPPRMALHVTVKTLDALQAAHRRSVVHRDIKPHNILLTPDGDIRITDFGIAQMRKWEDDDDGLTKTGAVMGTWGFMAPEQRQDAKTVDHRADIYSVGATLYSVLTDKTPVDIFAADMDASMMSDIDPRVADVIKRATRYNRDERYADAEEMAAACREAIDLLPEDPPETAPLALPPQQEGMERPDPKAVDRQRPQGQAGSTSVGSSEVEESDFDSDVDSDVDQLSEQGSGTIVPPRGARAKAEASPGYPGVDPPNETAVPDDPTGIEEFAARKPGPQLAGLRPLPPLPEPVSSEAAPAPPLIRQLPRPTRPAVDPPTTPPPPPGTPIEFWVTSFIAGMALIALILVLLFALRPQLSAWMGGDPGETPTGVSEPETTKPETTKPEATKPETTAPETTAPETTAPEATKPEATKPEATKPETTKPETTKPETTPDPGSERGDGVVVVDPGPDRPPDGGPSDPGVVVKPRGLTVSAPSAGKVGQPLTFVVDAPEPGFEVVLYYRSLAGGDWQKAFARADGARYTVTLTPGPELAGGMAWYVRGVKGSEDLKEGTGFKPNRLPVKP